MQMIPDTPYDTRSRAELHVFDALRRALNHTDFTCYHSLNLPYHKKKRFGEIDFLLCGSQGIYVLEVKGGRLRCDEECYWYFMDRYGNEVKKKEGPFRQAETALHGFITNLKNNFSSNKINKFAIGYGVITPDCELDKSAEWAPETYAGAAQSKYLESWLEKFIKYWRGKHFKSEPAPDNLVDEVKTFIRPSFEAVIPLFRLSSEAESQIKALTNDQIEFLDGVWENDRILCHGGAGTGKTFMALEVARRWTANGENVLLACHSSWLKCYLESSFKIPGLTVSTVSAIPVMVRRSGIDKFSALIVDEGQDLFTKKEIAILDKFLDKGLADGKWCFFYDSNNQADISGKFDPEVLASIKELRPTVLPLKINSRNTKLILDEIKTKLNADMGVRGAGAGPDVEVQIVFSREEAAKLLEEEIHRIVYEGGILPGNLTILSAKPFDLSSISLMDPQMLDSIMVLDEYVLRDFPVSQINFSEIKNFKGLENEAIIVIDLPPPENAEKTKAIHYVAMSRARAILSMIYVQDE